MARTIAEIKKEMTDVFMANDTIKALYGLDPDPERTFEDQFSKVSLESILFHVVATCIWTLEKMFDRHKQEVDDLISELKPHSLLWYANKAKAFQFSESISGGGSLPQLIKDSDVYDNSRKTDQEIEAMRVVKYAAVVEKEGVVLVKVATGNGGERHPLSGEQLAALKAYFKEVKDAGVKLVVENKPANEFNIDIDVYYDPQVFDNTLKKLNTREQTVHDTIAAFVENLPFNGEYRNSTLINVLTNLEGVVLVELKRAAKDGQPIDAKCVPEAGYFRVDKNKLGINAIAYESISDQL